MLRVCRKCGIEKKLTDFSPDSKSSYGYKHMCRSCNSAYVKAHRKANNNKKSNENHRRYRQNLRRQVLKEYGHKCVHCGEKRYEFLTIDHIFNDGAAHKKQLGNKGRGGELIYIDIKRQGYPKDKYQVLCYNCNAVKQYHGYNPVLVERHLLEEMQNYMGDGI
jgi:hypothetical protein